MLGSAESEMVRLISRDIIFAEFQPIITIPQRFAIFAQLKESMTLNLVRDHPRSSILVPIESVYTYSY